MGQDRGRARRSGAFVRLVCALVAVAVLASCSDSKGSGPVRVIGTADSWKPIAGTGMTGRFVHATVWTGDEMV